jgi:hypothetical protein
MAVLGFPFRPHSELMETIHSRHLSFVAEQRDSKVREELFLDGAIILSAEIWLDLDLKSSKSNYVISNYS